MTSLGWDMTLHLYQLYSSLAVIYTQLGTETTL